VQAWAGTAATASAALISAASRSLFAMTVRTAGGR
jgi:hypothetical protein